MQLKGAAFRSGFLGALSALLLLAAAAVLLAFTGLYDVSATRPHASISRWFLSLAMERSVRFHAQKLPAAAPADSSLLRHGASHFRTMCVDCHGAPGIDPGEIGQGLNPGAPELSRTVGRWSDGELSWILRHGIRMTGMPAFGKTHDDEEIRSLVTFLRALEGRTPEAYAGMMRVLDPPKSAHPDTGHSGNNPPAWKRRSLF